MPHQANDSETDESLRIPLGGRSKDPHEKTSFAPTKEAQESLVLRDRLPAIGSSGSKSIAKPTLPILHPRQSQGGRTKCSKQPSQHRRSLASTLPDTMTPWGCLSLSESSFTSIPPPAPQTPSSLPRRPVRHPEGLITNLRSPAPPPPVTIPVESAGRGGQGVRLRRRVVPHQRPPRAPRLPPLRPVTNLSFSRSFTFSFFELPVHQLPRCRAERTKDLMLLLRQIQY